MKVQRIEDKFKTVLMLPLLSELPSQLMLKHFTALPVIRQPPAPAQLFTLPSPDPSPIGNIRQ